MIAAASLLLAIPQTSYIGNAGVIAPSATSAAVSSVQREAVAASAVAASAVAADHGGEDYADGLCIVCFDAHRSAILAPCGHIAMCT